MKVDINTDPDLIYEKIAKRMRPDLWDWREAHSQGIKAMGIINGGKPQVCFTIPAGVKCINGQDAIPVAVYAGITKGIIDTIKANQSQHGGKFTIDLGTFVYAGPTIYLNIKHEPDGLFMKNVRKAYKKEEA